MEKYDFFKGLIKVICLGKVYCCDNDDVIYFY